MVAGGCHTLLWTITDRLFAWGENSNGQLGLNDPVARNRPTQVPLALAPDEHIAQVMAGAFHTLLLTNTNRIARSVATISLASSA